jgi:hypothetical protein
MVKQCWVKRFVKDRAERAEKERDEIVKARKKDAHQITVWYAKYQKARALLREAGQWVADYIELHDEERFCKCEICMRARALLTRIEEALHLPQQGETPKPFGEREGP